MKPLDQQSAGGSRFSVNFLKRLKLWQKFTVLGVVVVPAMLLPLSEFYVLTEEAVDFSLTEQRGLEPATTLLKLVQLTQQHGNLSGAVAGGNATLASARAVKEAEVTEVTAKIDVQMKNIDNKAITERWAKNKLGFAKISRDRANRVADSMMSFNDHSQLLGEHLLLLDGVVDYYKLSLDPDAHTYFLIQAAFSALPALTEMFDQLRSLGATLLVNTHELRDSSKKGEALKLSNIDRQHISALVDEAHRQTLLLDRLIQKVFTAAPRLAQGKIASDLKVADEVSDQLLDLVKKQILNTEMMTFNSEEYAKLFTQGIDKQFAFSGDLDELTATELEHKIAGLRTNQFTQAGLALALMVIAITLGVTIIRSVLRPVSHLRGVMEGLRQGDTTLRSRLDSSDEIGDLGRQFDTMVDEREAVAAKIKKENDTLNDSIIDIMRTVAKAAGGDLRVRAPVREDVTGALSDAINSMSESTAQTLANVTNVSNEVRSASQEGRDTVLRTSKGMNDIRGTIQETGKRIKRLGERSQEITGIVKLIDDIAERTSVLALNANMQAAMAGEAGRGFRVVADEVQRLAERSKEATEQIGKLVGTIQAETNDTMMTMDRAISEVVKGGELADKAAAQVTHLDELGGTLLESVQAFTLPEGMVKAPTVRDNRKAA